LKVTITLEAIQGYELEKLFGNNGKRLPSTGGQDDDDRTILGFKGTCLTNLTLQNS
jgi:hypothetical protein